MGAVLMQLAEAEEPPVRFAAGSDAVAWLVDKANALRTEAERWGALAAASDSKAAAPGAPDVRKPT